MGEVYLLSGRKYTLFPVIIQDNTLVFMLQCINARCILFFAVYLSYLLHASYSFSYPHFGMPNLQPQ